MLQMFIVVINKQNFSSSEIFLLYAKLEMEFGMARHAMAVYDRATRAVLPEQQPEVCLEELWQIVVFLYENVRFYKIIITLLLKQQQRNFPSST